MFDKRNEDCPPVLDIPEKFRERNSESPRNLLHIHQCDVVFVALDPTDVGSIQATPVGKLFLRHTKLVPSATDGFHILLRG